MEEEPRIPPDRGEDREYETESDIELELTLNCGHQGCPNSTVVKLLKGASSCGYYHNKEFGTFDMRNVAFVCNEHQACYDKWFKEQGLEKIYGKMFLNQTMS